MTFFVSLPTDLQVEIFQTFLGCSDAGLLALAGLDSACCNRTHRPHFLSLMAIAFNKCKARVTFGKKWCFGKKLHWLLSRGVDIDELALIGKHDDGHAAHRQVYAGYVHETILWMSPMHTYQNASPLCYVDTQTVASSVTKVAFEPSDSMEELDGIPNIFPNMTCLSACFLREDGSEVITQFWTKLAVLDLPKLQKLKVRNFMFQGDCAPMAATIERSGNNLVELVMFECGATSACDAILLLKTIVQSCQRLQKAELTLHDATSTHTRPPPTDVGAMQQLVIELVDANKSLVSLKLHHSPFDQENITAILTAAEAEVGVPLRAFQCSGWFGVTHDSAANQFAAILEHFAWLDVFQLNYVSFCRSSRSLVLTDVGLSEVCLDRIFSVCSPTTKLTVMCKEWRRDEPNVETLQKRIGERFGAQLLSLVFLDERGHENQIIGRRQLIKQCPQLKELTVVDSVDDDLAQFIAEHCKYLETFCCCPLDCHGKRVIKDKGAIALLTGCKNLLSVDLGIAHITLNTLTAIVDNKLKLKSLKMGVLQSTNREVIVRFKALAVEQQLIPVPNIEIYVVDAH